MAKEQAAASAPQNKSADGGSYAPALTDFERIVRQTIGQTTDEPEKVEQAQSDDNAESSDSAEDSTTDLSQSNDAEEQKASEDDTESTDESTGESEEAEESEEQSDSEVGDEEADPQFEYPKFKKRVDELTRQKKEALEKAETLQRELESLKDKAATLPDVPPSQATRFGHLKSIAEVREEAQRAEDVIAWAIEHSDGAVVKEGDKEVEYSADQIAKIRYQAERALRTDLPAQAQYLVQREQWDAFADKEYNWWKDKTSSEYQLAHAALRAFPEVMRLPEWKLAVADMIAGRLAREAKAKEAKSAAAAKKVPPKAPPAPKKTTVAPRKVDKKEALREGLLHQVAQSGGDVNFLEKYLKNTL